MAKWLKVDCSAGDSYVMINPGYTPGSGGTVHVEFDIVVLASSLAALDSVPNPFTANWFETFTPANNGDGIFGEKISGVWKYATDFGYDAGTPAIATDVVVHIVYEATNTSGSLWDILATADGTTIRSVTGTSTWGPPTDTITELDLGAVFASGVTGEVYYLDNFVLKNGSGTVLFSDDFEDGTTGAWDSVTGDATVVDYDPGGGGPVAPTNTDCASAQILVGCGGTVVYDNRAWAGTWPVGGDPLFNSPDVAEGGGAPGFYQWRNTKGRRMLFSVQVVAPDDHPVNYNLGLNVAADCASLTFVDDAGDLAFVGRERGNWSGAFTADDFGPTTPTTFDIVVDPGHIAWLEVDSWTGDASEPPDTTGKLGKIKFEWSALEFTSYDTTEGAQGPVGLPQSALLVDPVDADEASITPYATLILDDILFMLWRDNQGDGDHLFAGSCALDGSGFVAQDLGTPGEDARWREPQLYTDGSDVIVGFWNRSDPFKNPGYTDSCLVHEGEVYECFECSLTSATTYLYHLFRSGGAGSWVEFCTIINETATNHGFTPDISDVAISTDGSIAAFTVCSFTSPASPGKVYVHAAYRVTVATQSLHHNNYPLTGGPGPAGGDSGSLWCTVDQAKVVERVDTFEVDIASGVYTSVERIENEVGGLRDFVSEDPNIDPAFGDWQIFAEGDLIGDQTTPRDSIIYSPNGLDGRSDEGYPLVAFCKATTVVPSAGAWDQSYENQITLRRLDGFVVVATYTYDDFNGIDASSTRYASIVRLGPRFIDPDDLDAKRSLGGTWVNNPSSGGTRSITDLIGADGTGTLAYIVAGDQASSTLLLGWVLPDTLVPGGRQWWGQIPLTEFTIHHYDYCDPPGWRSTWDSFTGSDVLGSSFTISAFSAYDVANDDFYFLVANSQLRKAHVLRDYFICEPGSPCVPVIGLYLETVSIMLPYREPHLTLAPA